MSTEPNKQNEGTNDTVRKMTRIAIFAAILAILSQIAFPMPSGVSFTLQTFAVCLCGYLLGARDSAVAVGVYIFQGVCGAPVFTGFSGGIHKLAGPTGGFIVGFLALAVLCGICKERGMRASFAAGAAGIVICHLCGVLWYSYIAKTGVLSAFLAVSAIYIPKDILSCVAAYIAARAMKKQIIRGDNK